MFLIEVGANDGTILSKTNKLLKESSEWSGILIEPIKEYYNELCSLYKNRENLVLLNLAISNEISEKEIYKIDPNFLVNHPYGKGVSSFNRNHPGIERLEKEFGVKSVLVDKIRTVPLSKIIEDYSITEIDLLIIDTEGHDFEVIKSLDFGKVKPKKIIYENKHLHRKNSECENYLISKGYNIQNKNNVDTTMILV